MNDLGMMRDPMTWPNPILPIVNRKARRELKGETVGVLNGSGPTIYFMNMWDPQWAGTKWSEIPHKTYDSFEAIVADGWEVD